MSLPTVLRPWWPLFKRLHLVLTRVVGSATRTLSRPLGPRGVPTAATERSVETSRLEPESVTLHPGRPGGALRRRVTVGEPAGHPAFVDPPYSEVPATFTLEVANGRLTGDYAALSTPGKVLDHETSTYFGVEDWRRHPLFLRPSLGRRTVVPGTVASLTARGCAINYYHFLYDAIARISVLEDTVPDEVPDAYVVPHATRYQRELLALAGIDAPLIQPRRGHTVVAERLLVPSNPNWALQAPPASVRWLRERLVPATRTTIRRIYVTRGSSPRTRRVVHEDTLWPELERRGFVRIDPGTLSVQEQIDTFAGAEAIVAPHGAGLTNVTFSPPEVKVLELFASSYVHLGLWAICEALGADYRYLVSPGPAGSNTGVHDDVTVSTRAVVEQVDELLS